jgi:hypothetical protein
MSNPLPVNNRTGLFGELLVQIRLLQFGVQAAPPIEDSGNDLIAVNGKEFRTVSVRTTTSNTYTKPKGARIYDVLAVVCLKGGDNEVFLDSSQIFLIPQRVVTKVSTNANRLSEKYVFSKVLVETLFGKLSV